MLGFEFKNGNLQKKVSVKNSDFKQLMFDLKSNYKYKDVFIKDNYNTSFALLIIENFAIISQYVLADYNKNIDIKITVKYSEKNDQFNIYLDISKFYDVDFTKIENTTFEEYLKGIDEIEKDILENYLEKLFDEENVQNKLFNYCERTNNIDTSIRIYKEKNEEIKKKKFDFFILTGLFDVYALNVSKDIVKEEYLEEGENE